MYDGVYMKEISSLKGFLKDKIMYMHIFAFFLFTLALSLVGVISITYVELFGASGENRAIVLLGFTALTFMASIMYVIMCISINKYAKEKKI